MFLAQQKLRGGGGKSAFSNNYNPLGAGMIISIRQQLTESEFYIITTVAGL